MTDHPFKVEEWDDAGVHLVEVLATAANHSIALAAYEAALIARPRATITLRHGARVIKERKAPGQ